MERAAARGYKMADRQVVLSTPFFFFTKFFKLLMKQIKTTLVVFFPSEEVTAVKERLVNDAQALNYREC